MRRKPPVDGERLWEIVTATVRPLRGRQASRAATAGVAETPARLAPTTPPPPPPRFRKIPKAPSPTATPPPTRTQPPAVRPIEAIEPGRRRRLHRDRDAHGDCLDLHGLTQDQARAALTGFVLRAWSERQRHVLVITGKGALGDGVLRRRVPEWLAEPPLRKVVAGLSEAHRRHGGEGALHVALKRVETP